MVEDGEAETAEDRDAIDTGLGSDMITIWITFCMISLERLSF